MLLLVLILVLISIVGVYLYRRKDKMPIYKGNKEISELYHGSKQIGELYHGSTLVYESYKEPWYKSDESGYRYGVIENSTVTDKGVYNRGLLGSVDTLHQLVDNKIWFNKMNSELTALRGANYYYYGNGQPIVFKNGDLYTINNTNYTKRLTGGWEKAFGEPENNAVYAVKNKEIYKIVFEAGNNPTVKSTTKVMNFNSSVIPSKWYATNYVIIDGNLYSGARSSSLTLVDSGGWTAVESYYGIKNNQAYYIYNGIVVIDNSKNWVDVYNINSASTTYFIADDGTLGVFRNNTFTKEPFRKSQKLKGRWESFSKSAGGLIIRNGALYKLMFDKVILIDDTRYYTECSGNYTYGVAVSSGNRIIDNS